MGACSNEEDLYWDRPEDTNLECWLTEPFDAETFEGHAAEIGCFGCDIYLGEGYEFNEDRTYPDIYVEYTFTGYPDAMDGSRCTSIVITDPEVHFLGLSVDSSLEEIGTVMGDLGFSKGENNMGKPAFRKGRFSLIVYERKLTLTATSTNYSNVIY